MLILDKMPGCTADAELDGFSRQMKRLPVVLRQLFLIRPDPRPIGQTEQKGAVRRMSPQRRKTYGWKTPQEAMTEELAVVRSDRSPGI